MSASERKCPIVGVWVISDCDHRVTQSAFGATGANASNIDCGIVPP
jgi:hypothetical protein